MNPRPKSPSLPVFLSSGLLLRFLLLVSFFVVRSSALAAESPLYIPFQGQVTNQAGATVADGQYSVIFNLYDQAVGGQPVWSERHVKIGATRGMINVFLGSITALTTVDFSQTKYLGITVDIDNLATTADPEMVPRSLIMPAFHAKNAENSGKLVGQDWSAFLVNGSGTPSNDPANGYLSAAKILPASITVNQLQDFAVTSEKIQNGTVVSADLSASLLADILIPPGCVMPFAGTAAPAGWHLCDGSSQLRTDPAFSRLFGIIGPAHGAADEASFNLPDYRGRFLRGVDGTDSRDPDRTSRTAMNSGGNSGNSVGSIQSEATKRNGLSLAGTTAFASANHTHDGGEMFVPWTSVNGVVYFRHVGGKPFWPADRSMITNGAGNIQITRDTGIPVAGTSTGPSSTGSVSLGAGDSETRPINAYVYYIIKL